MNEYTDISYANENDVEEVKDYVNKDLYGLTPGEFHDKFNTYKPQSKDFIENLEWALLYLNVDKAGHPLRYSEVKNNCFYMNTFDGAWLISVDRLGTSEENGLKFLNPASEQAMLNMFPEFNMKFFNLGNTEDLTMLNKVRLLPSKEIRHIKGSSKYIEFRQAIISKDEKWYTTGNHYAEYVTRINGVNSLTLLPQTIDPNYCYTKKAIKEYVESDSFKETNRVYTMSLNMKLTAYYEWFVYIRENDKSLGVKIPVAPEASKEIFALRNVPEGAARKKAICNFVKEHYRVTKNEYNEEFRQTLVKQHFRGETKFNWRGLQVNIIPAEYDMNRVKSKKKFIKI